MEAYLVVGRWAYAPTRPTFVVLLSMAHRAKVDAKFMNRARTVSHDGTATHRVTSHEMYDIENRYNIQVTALLFLYVDGDK